MLKPSAIIWQLRPDVWLMIGHCGGLRESRAIGDYVLAHAYLRDDHVLDAVCRPIFLFRALLKCNVRFMTLPS